MYLFSKTRFALLWVILAVTLSGLVIVNSAIYFQPGPEPAFFLEKGQIADIPFWRAAFYFHIVGASVCLATGAPLMFPALLKYRIVHRTLGLVYVNAVLFVAAPGALIMAPVAKGGLAGASGFAISGVFWWYFTLAGWKAVRRGDMAAHIRSMVRSYALALSAPAFRVIQLGFYLTDMDDETNYVLSLWLSLAVSVWLSESCIQRHMQSQRQNAAANLKGEFS